jgi:hypothetical protein
MGYLYLGSVLTKSREKLSPEGLLPKSAEQLCGAGYMLTRFAPGNIEVGFSLVTQPLLKRQATFWISMKASGKVSL